jgi:hypothetical protein
MLRSNILSMPSARLRALDSASDLEFRKQVDALRGIEAAHPGIPIFDEMTLPARCAGELKAVWRMRQLRAMQQHIRKVVAMLDAKAGG